MTKEELLEDLRIGGIIPVDVKTRDGRYLVRKGTALTDSLIIKLRTWLLKPEIMIEYDEAIIEKKEKIAQISDDDLALNTESDLDRLYQTSISDLRLVIEDIKIDVNEFYKRLKDSKEWSYDDDSCYYHKSNNTEHYVRVAKLSIVLANMYNQGVPDEKKINLESIAMAALLKNYGKRFETESEELKKLYLDNTIVKNCNLPANLLNKPYNNEYHPVYAYAALSKYLPKSICTMVLLSKTQDHFSRRFDQTDPSVIAGKIINLCDIYDILLEKVIMDNVPVPLENVISYMAQLAHNDTIDKDVFNFFLYHIPAFKNGTKVMLSSGEEAVVVSSTPKFRTRPTVLTLPRMGSPILIDLTEKHDIVIESVVHDKKALNKTTDYTQKQIEDIKVGENSAMPEASHDRKIRLLDRIQNILDANNEEVIVTPIRKR